MNFPKNNTKDKQSYKVCNAINCYFSNEYLLGIGADFDNKQTQDCRFCAYNYDNIQALRKFINFELNKPKNNLNKILKKSFYLVMFIASITIVLIGVIVYNFDNIKSLFR